MNVQLCQVNKPDRCGRLSRFWSANLSKFVCDRHADPDSLSGGPIALSGMAEVLTPVGGS